MTFYQFAIAAFFTMATIYYFTKWKKLQKEVNTNEAIRDTLDGILEEMHALNLETQSVRILKRQRNIRYMIHQLIDMKFKDYKHPLLKDLVA